MIDISEVDAVPFQGFGSVNRVRFELGQIEISHLGLGLMSPNPSASRTQVQLTCLASRPSSA